MRAFGEDAQQVAVGQHPAGLREGALVGRRVVLLRRDRDRLASLNSAPSTGVAKMRWSMTKRIGRGLAAISSTASTKLTWLHTRIAAPCVGNVLVAVAPGSGRRSAQRRRRRSAAGTRAPAGRCRAATNALSSADDAEDLRDLTARPTAARRRAGAGDHEQRVQDVVGGDDACAVRGRRAQLDQRVHRHAVQPGEQRQQGQVDHHAPVRRLARGTAPRPTAAGSGGRPRDGEVQVDREHASCRSRRAAPGRSPRAGG